MSHKNQMRNRVIGPILLFVIFSIFAAVPPFLIARDFGASPEVQKFFNTVSAGNLSRAAKYLETVDVNVQAPDGTTALHLACVSEKADMVKFLLDEGAVHHLRDGRNKTPLHTCVSHNNIDTAHCLLKAGADINAVGSDFPDRPTESTPLFIAVQMGFNEMVKLLIDNGADVNYVNKYRETALIWATRLEKDEIAKLLESNGAVRDIEEARILSEKFQKKAELKPAEIQSDDEDGSTLEVLSEPKKKEPKISTDPAVLTKQGIQARRAGEFQDARKYLEAAVAIDGDKLLARAHLCLTYLSLNQKEKARVQYGFVKEKSPKTAAKLKKAFKKKERQKK